MEIGLLFCFCFLKTVFMGYHHQTRPRIWFLAVVTYRKGILLELMTPPPPTANQFHTVFDSDSNQFKTEFKPLNRKAAFCVKFIHGNSISLS